jgi:hypothetical protein
MSEFLYRLYGCNISCVFDCGDLPPAQGGDIDVHIIRGDVPQRIDAIQELPPYFQISPQATLITISQVARYLITDGSRIIIERAPLAIDEHIKIHLFASAMGILLHQRGLIPLHASSIDTPHGCIAFMGHSGFGKSTIAGALQQRGFRVMSDDICAIDLHNDNKIIALPGMPQLKLHTDSIQQQHRNFDHTVQQHTITQKYNLSLLDHYCDQSRPLFMLCALQLSDNNSPNSIILRGIDKITALVYNTYRADILSGLGQTFIHFEKCSQIAKHTRMIQLFRPTQINSLDNFVHFVEQLILST